jgi:hypothetical protein
MTANGWFVIVVLLIMLAGCRGGLSDRDLAEKIRSRDRQLSAVEITARTQTYDDSHRSPNDIGKSYVVRARVTTSNGKVEEREYKVFVANSDGFVSVQRR